MSIAVSGLSKTPGLICSKLMVRSSNARRLVKLPEKREAENAVSSLESIE